MAFRATTLPSQSSTSLPGLLSQCLCLSLLSVQVLPLLQGWYNPESPSASLEIKLEPLLSTPYLLGETGLDSCDLGETTGGNGTEAAPSQVRWTPLKEDPAECQEEGSRGSQRDLWVCLSGGEAWVAQSHRLGPGLR